ncbi:MAG: hypothetical protein JW982_11690 [Spirochaetes bacterium]|nr:hypothetical protein [Spirochaetota bacterium]
MKNTEITMAEALEFTDYRISRITGGHGFREKCIGLGLIPRTDLLIISKHSRGAAVVRVMDTRIMISSGMMNRIYLEEK